MLQTYAWTYGQLMAALKKRYTDFKANNDYHKLRNKICKAGKFKYERLLNPRNKSGGKKDFYNPNIVKEFDKYYSKRSSD